MDHIPQIKLVSIVDPLPPIVSCEVCPPTFCEMCPLASYDVCHMCYLHESYTSQLSKSLRSTYCFQTLYRILMVVRYICEYSMLAISRAFISHTEWANNVLIWLCKDVHLMFIFSRTTKQLILRLKIKTKQSVMT